MSDVEAQIARALPKGSSEAEAFAFLDANHYSSSLTAAPVTQSDGFLLAQSVPLGSLVIRGLIKNSSRRPFETGEIFIFIVLDEQRRVDRTYVFETLSGL